MANRDAANVDRPRALTALAKAMETCPEEANTISEALSNTRRTQPVGVLEATFRAGSRDDVRAAVQRLKAVADESDDDDDDSGIDWEAVGFIALLCFF
jgi:hypothetical protein